MFGETLEVSYRTVQYYVSRKKKILYEANTASFLPLEHQAGTAQVDFGKVAYLDKNNVEQMESYLTVSFPYSNAGFLQILPGENQECLLQGLKQIFEHMNCVPKRLLFDNLSAAVIIGKGKNKKERILVEQFQKFAIHYNFQIEFCNPNSGHEKGNVESKVGYLRRNLLVPRPQITDIDEFNQSLLSQCEVNMHRPHYKKGKSIHELYTIDLENMLELPKYSFEVGQIVRVKANKYGQVQYKTNLYSTAPQFAQQEVILKITHNEIIVLDEKYQVITKHARLYGQKQEAMNWLPYLCLISRRPKSIYQIPFFKTLPKPWQDYIQHSEDKKEVIDLLSKMLGDKYDIPLATKALIETEKSGTNDTASVLSTWHYLKNPNTIEKELSLPSGIQQQDIFQADINSYDALLRGIQDEK